MAHNELCTSVCFKIIVKHPDYQQKDSGPSHWILQVMSSVVVQESILSIKIHMLPSKE